jgi:hypothetical protein
VFRARATVRWVLLDQRSIGRDLARIFLEVELVNDGTATATDTMVVARDQSEQKRRSDWDRQRPRTPLAL